MIRGLIEEISLPVSSVDVIVSEWMGYELLYECMLESVLAARDRFLRPGGDIFPDRACLLATGLSDPGLRGRRLGWLEHCWESDFRAAAPLLATAVLVEDVEAEAAATDCATVAALDLKTLGLSPPGSCFRSLSAPLEFRLRVRGGGGRGGARSQIDAVCLSFCVGFGMDRSPTASGSRPSRHPVTLSTSPSEPRTHWRQTVLTLTEPLPVEAGCELVGFLQVLPLGRGLDLRLQLGRAEGPTAEEEPEVQRFVHW